MKKWKILTSNKVIENKWLTVRQDVVQLPNGKVYDDYFVVESPKVAMIIAFTEEGQILLVKQYKHGVGEIMIEFPAGYVDKDEEPEEAARRELLEETGYRAVEMYYLGKHAPNVSRMSEEVYIYLAERVVDTGIKQLDETEEIEVLTVAETEMVDMIKAGEVWASVTLAAYLLYQQHKA